MAQERMPKFEIPAEMRQMAEQSVEQARKAFDGFIAAAQKAVSTFEGQAAVAQAGARDVGKKAMTFAEQNVANSFEFAHKLVRAKDAREIAGLHSEFIRAQMEALSNQAEELGEAASRVAKDASR
jgi:phasin